MKLRKLDTRPRAPADGSWTVGSADALRLARTLARGYYQAAIIDGREASSGSTLRGKAKKWASRYARSRANLYDRMESAGLRVVRVETGPSGKLILALSLPGEPHPLPRLPEVAS